MSIVCFAFYSEPGERRPKRKRGSLFFRKKKEKHPKNKNNDGKFITILLEFIICMHMRIYVMYLCVRPHLESLTLFLEYSQQE